MHKGTIKYLASCILYFALHDRLVSILMMDVINCFTVSFISDFSDFKMQLFWEGRIHLPDR